MPDVKMNYESMESMKRAFHQAHQQVQDSIGDMKNVAQTLEGGALLGQAGDRLADGIKSELVSAMNEIADKLNELEGDIQGAIDTTQKGVSHAQGRFNY